MDSQQSPAAHTPAADVRCWRSTTTAPRTPVSRPAAAPKALLGSTPSPSTTRSARTLALIGVYRGVGDGCHRLSHPDRDPRVAQGPGDEAPISGSSVPITSGSASMMVTDVRRSTNASASSRPT